MPCQVIEKIWTIMRAVKYRKSPVATLLERNWQAHKETSKRKVQRINGHSLIGEYLPARRRNARRKTRLGEKNRPRGGEKIRILRPDARGCTISRAFDCSPCFCNGSTWKSKAIPTKAQMITTRQTSDCRAKQTTPFIVLKPLSSDICHCLMQCTTIINAHSSVCIFWSILDFFRKEAQKHRRELTGFRTRYTSRKGSRTWLWKFLK